MTVRHVWRRCLRVVREAAVFVIAIVVVVGLWAIAWLEGVEREEM